MRVVFILSGKGGVGKSTFSALLVSSLSRCEFKIGLLDLDLCGPSSAITLGVNTADIVKDLNGRWLPYSISPNVSCLSMAFLLSSPDSSVVWRGARKNALINELCSNVAWGEIDFLIVDTPPGIQEEHITLAEFFYKKPNVCGIMITTPHGLSIDDIHRHLTFCRRTGIKLLGILENMKRFQCPCCKESYPIWGESHVESFCQREEAVYLGAIDIMTSLCQVIDNGSVLSHKFDVVEEITAKLIDYFNVI